MFWHSDIHQSIRIPAGGSQLGTKNTPKQSFDRAVPPLHMKVVRATGQGAVALPAACCIHMGCKRPLGAITGIYALGMRCSLAFVPSTAPHALRFACNGLHRARTAVVPASSTRRSLLWSARTTTSMDTANGERKKVVFLGTPEIAASSLGLLLEASRQGKGGGFDVVRAVSNPPARTGRKKVLQPSAVQALADSEGVTVMTPATARDEEFLAGLEELQPDLCITAAYGQFLPRRFLDIPKFGTLNVHPSLLPLYRGASPVQRCLEAGDTETGVTVAFTVLKMDAGPVVRQTVTSLVQNSVSCVRGGQMLRDTQLNVQQ